MTTVSTPQVPNALGDKPASRQPRPLRKRRRSASAGLHAGLSICAFIAVFPILWIFYISLGPDKNDYQHPSRILNHITFDNYTHVLRNTGFGTWMMNSLIVAFGTMLIGVLIAASAAYAVSRMKFLGRGSLMYTFLLTQMFPVAVLMVPSTRSWEGSVCSTPTAA